ncbi:DUF3265 domain-containing protein, partial [Vibrio anguillarum]|nr:DUF3265 domain-containing protein [Vibrio anguillarum]
MYSRQKNGGQKLTNCSNGQINAWHFWFGWLLCLR